MEISEEKAHEIAMKIEPNYERLVRKYRYDKYPKDPYDNFKEIFSNLTQENNKIEKALIWKWGHWCKKNFPQSHRNLIKEVNDLWPEFIESKVGSDSKNTFFWWRKRLVKYHRFITVAYLTHLVHHKQIYIIDQHNFRAVNYLIGVGNAKKKPSNWEDVLLVKDFIEKVCKVMNENDYGKMDRFLMEYGKEVKNSR